MKYRPLDMFIKQTDELKELITKYPDYPIVVMVDREEYDADRWKCSKCGRTVLWQEKFCPSCGVCMKDGRTLDEFIADMRGDTDADSN